MLTDEKGYNHIIKQLEHFWENHLFNDINILYDLSTNSNMQNQFYCKIEE